MSDRGSRAYHSRIPVAKHQTERKTEISRIGASQSYLKLKTSIVNGFKAKNIASEWYLDRWPKRIAREGFLGTSGELWCSLYKKLRVWRVHGESLICHWFSRFMNVRDHSMKKDSQ